jgi:hypothetical protein
MKQKIVSNHPDDTFFRYNLVNDPVLEFSDKDGNNHFFVINVKKTQTIHIYNPESNKIDIDINGLSLNKSAIGYTDLKDISKDNLNEFKYLIKDTLNYNLAQKLILLGVTFLGGTFFDFSSISSIFPDTIENLIDQYIENEPHSPSFLARILVTSTLTLSALRYFVWANHKHESMIIDLNQKIENAWVNITWTNKNKDNKPDLI